MTIARINEFHSTPGQGDTLHALLASFADAIATTEGCESVSVLRSQADPDTIVIYEVWESVEHHQAAARVIPADAIESTIALLTTPPEGEYFDVH